MFCSVIGREVLRFQFLLSGDKLTLVEKQLYAQLIKVEQESFSMVEADLVNSLLTLSELLRKHYGQKVIILIDE